MLPPDLGPAEVHVWCARLDRLPSDLAALAALLSDEERHAAARLRMDHLRRRSAAARGLLRTILAAYLRRDPAGLAIERGARGKPYLSNGALSFNVAHTGDLALYAVARERPVGVDLEPLRRLDDASAVSERFFAPSERLALAALPPERQTEAFMRVWTRKEAYLKARGDGLALDLCSFAVSADAEPTLRPVGDAADSAGWTIHHLSPAPGFVGALVVGGGPVTVRAATWEPSTL